MFLFLRLSNGVHLVVNSGHSLLLVVDFDIYTHTYFLKGVPDQFFFTKIKILRSSTTIVFCGLPGLLVLLVNSTFFLYKNVPKRLTWLQINVFVTSLKGLFRVVHPSDGSFYWIVGLHIKRSKCK